MPGAGSPPAVSAWGAGGLPGSDGGGRDRGRDRAYVESVMAAQVSDLERIRRAHRLVLNTADRGTLRRRALHALEQVLEGGPGEGEDSAVR